MIALNQFLLIFLLLSVCTAFQNDYWRNLSKHRTYRTAVKKLHYTCGLAVQLSGVQFGPVKGPVKCATCKRVAGPASKRSKVNNIVLKMNTFSFTFYLILRIFASMMPRGALYVPPKLGSTSLSSSTGYQTWPGFLYWCH